MKIQSKIELFFFGGFIRHGAIDAVGDRGVLAAFEQAVEVAAVVAVHLFLIGLLRSFVAREFLLRRYKILTQPGLSRGFLLFLMVLYEPSKRELIQRVDNQQYGEKTNQSFQLHTCRFWGPKQALKPIIFKDGKYSGFGAKAGAKIEAFVLDF
mgnify:CR=1 FL=1